MSTIYSAASGSGTATCDNGEVDPRLRAGRRARRSSRLSSIVVAAVHLAVAAPAIAPRLITVPSLVAIVSVSIPSIVATTSPIASPVPIGKQATRDAHEERKNGHVRQDGFHRQSPHPEE